jgi:hypothetical protein
LVASKYLNSNCRGIELDPCHRPRHSVSKRIRQLASVRLETLIVDAAFSPSPESLFVAMKIVSTFHQPSSVLCSLKCHLTSSESGDLHLVIAKLNSLDVYSVQPEGLKHEHRWDVWGNILSLKSVQTGVSFKFLQFTLLCDSN